MKPRYKLKCDGSFELLQFQTSCARPTATPRTPESLEDLSVSGMAVGMGTLATQMHPEQIKASIRMKGTTPSALADSMSRSRMLVSNVIHGRAVSRPVADRIAKLLGCRADQLWPGKYKPAAKRGHA